MRDVRRSLAPSAPQAREYELENAARHRAGVLNDAELGLENLKSALGDPKMMQTVMQMMQDPNALAEVQKMMSDPTFKAQAQRMMQTLQQEGGMPDLSAYANQFGQAMDGGVEQLRRENAQLRNRLQRDEL